MGLELRAQGLGFRELDVKSVLEDVCKSAEEVSLVLVLYILCVD